MAQEILIIETSPRGGEGFTARALFLYPLSPQLETFGGLVIVPTPSSSLPSELSPLNLLTPAELSALDDGSAAFEIAAVYIPEVADLADAAARVQKAYAGSSFVSDLRRRLAFTGRRLNKPVGS